MDDFHFLHTLTPAESDALEDMGEPRGYPAGEVIFEQGGTADCVLLVRTGRVRVTVTAGDGEDIVLAGTALDEVRGLVIPLRAFRGFLMEHPRAALSLLELMSRRLREAEVARVAEVQARRAGR